MTFEDFDYVDIDYDDNTFTLYRDREEYTYDIDKENKLYNKIMNSDIEKFEVYSQEEEYYTEEEEGKSIDDDIKNLWKELEDL